MDSGDWKVIKPYQRWRLIEIKEEIDTEKEVVGVN